METDKLLLRSKQHLNTRLEECNNDLLVCVDKAQEYKTKSKLRLIFIFWCSIIISIVITAIAFGVLFNYIYLPYDGVFRENNATLTKLKKQLVIIQKQYAISKAQNQKIINNFVIPWQIIWGNTKVKSQYGDHWCVGICEGQYLDPLPCAVDTEYCTPTLDPNKVCITFNILESFCRCKGFIPFDLFLM